MVMTVDFRGVQLCKVGDWNPLFGDGKVTREELESMVEAYQDKEVDRARLKLGHVSGMNTALGDGTPAFGWVENPRMDADGTKNGYDIPLTRAVAEAVNVPVIASGGAGTLEHFYDVLALGKADAVLAASVFHYKTFTIRQVKQYLRDKGVEVRL